MPWIKGQSGNKGGRPVLNEVEKQNVSYFKEELKRHSVIALEELVNLMVNSQNPEMKYKCSTYILDRCYGRDFVAERMEEQNKDIRIHLVTVQNNEVDSEWIEEQIKEAEELKEENIDSEWMDDIYLGED